MASGSVQISVALIGVAGSLAVAYVTTGAAFESKLRADSASVSQLRDSVRIATTRLSSELHQAEEEIARLNQTLASARTSVNTLTQQVNVVGAKVEQLHLSPAVKQLMQAPHN